MRFSVPLIWLGLYFALPSLCDADALPDRTHTPGVINETLSQHTYLLQCRERGWTRLYRPPAAFTNRLKRQQMRQYGYANRDPRDFEEDHLIPLCLGGAPQDPRNLWPQPRFGQWSAAQKDALENRLCHLACAGRVPLRDAQRDIATNWIYAYNRYMKTH